MPRRSPFPGMDPYLERHWLDVHLRLNYLASEVLQPQLGGRLFARTEERVIVEVPSIDRPRPIGPDVRVVEVDPSRVVEPSAIATLATEPVVFTFEVEHLRQRYIEIRDVATGGRLVTVIEFTSPSNKFPGDGRRKYQRKLDECRDALVNIVEVDLTRDGERQLFVDRWAQASGHASTYAVSIWRAADEGRCALHAIRLQDRLPTIRIPLRNGDADASLDLQALIDRLYESGAYGLTIDYAKPPEPPLSPEDAAWAATLAAAPSSP